MSEALLEPAEVPVMLRPRKRPRMQFVVRCTPTLGAVSIWWAKACESLLRPSNCGLGVHYEIDGVGDEVAEMRNRIVTHVLSMDNEHNEMAALFWVDDDMIVTAGALVQLMSHNRDIVSGVYFSKLPGRLSVPLIFSHKGCGTDPFIPAESDGQRSYEVWGHGMGLTLVKADVYRRMQEELNLPRDKYGHTQWYKTTRMIQEDGTVDVQHGVLNGGGTEDLFFLDNAAKCGYKPLIDCSKHAFAFHFDLNSGKCYPEEQWRQYQSRKPIVWTLPDGKTVTWE